MFKKRFLPYFDGDGGAGGGGTGPDGGGKADGESGDGKQQEKTFTQQELDTIVKDRIGRATKDMPGKEDLAAFKKWQDDQKTDLQKSGDAITALTKERDDAVSKSTGLERAFAAAKKGVPGDLAEKYAKLAESYLGEDGDFDKAMDAALKDFPVTSVPDKSKGVPGAGGNPPPGESGDKKKRPEGRVVF